MNQRRGRAQSGLLTKSDLESMSNFRYQLRKFLRYSEEITHAAGITPLQYQLLLHVRGVPGKSCATVGEIAERLQAAPNGTAALVNRCEAAGLVVRKPGQADRRLVEVHLTPKGERCLLKLAALHLAEYRTFGWLANSVNVHG
ncbi:MarR family transcriptional regulator [Caballeronia arationis]|uniref:MarR family winged helix-turn-helix transcriptional regulator n=1 Tax=Caballeronia arationis TaxID=1777142 RepID=UPI00074B89D6|nr:MarR family winged helix-turn-helix transcriptional regulator [Caballeronia arationis]SAL01408.1 MarR family transcriptional regulator [Caballeronia arationis]